MMKIAIVALLPVTNVLALISFQLEDFIRE